MNTHQNARTTVHGRALLVNRIIVKGWRVADAAQAAGVSARCAYTWLDRLKKGGELPSPYTKVLILGRPARAAFSFGRVVNDEVWRLDDVTRHGESGGPGEDQHGRRRTALPGEIVI